MTWRALTRERNVIAVRRDPARIIHELRSQTRGKVSFDMDEIVPLRVGGSLKVLRCIGCVLLLACNSSQAPSAAQASAGRGKAVEGIARSTEVEVAHPRFRVVLPAAWAVKTLNPEPRAPLGTTDPGALALGAEGADGGYVEVWFARPETEDVIDEQWELVAAAGEREVARIVERPFCTAEDRRKCLADPEDDLCVCGVGDGHLDIRAQFGGASLYRTYPVWIALGNRVKEDVDRGPFRRIVRSFRLVGPVDLADPATPYPKAWTDKLGLPPGSRPPAEERR